MLARYFMELEPCSDMIQMNELLSLISTEKKAKVGRMLFDIDKQLAVYSEVLLRSLICESLLISNRDICFGKNEFGKPYLVNYPDYHFNVSHTRNAIVVATDDLPVGIDIEKIKEADREVACQVFTPEECAYIYAKDKDAAVRFCEIWTKKEAYLKWTGEGWTSDFSGNCRERSAISVQVESSIIGRYIITTCTERVNINTLIIHLTETEFLKRTEIFCRS